MTESEILHVGIADAKIAVHPQHLRTAGLGSCVGVVIYDKQKDWQAWRMSCFLIRAWQSNHR